MENRWILLFASAFSLHVVFVEECNENLLHSRVAGKGQGISTHVKTIDTSSPHVLRA